MHLATRIALAMALAPTLCIATGATPAVAQESEPAQAAMEAGSEDRNLNEVVVTARKRAERAQDTPLSIATFDPEQLSERRIENLRDLQAAVPTMQVSATQAGSSANAQLYMRGVGNQDFRVTSDQAVGLYVDGVFLARSMGASLDVVDVAQVEVLRGPQGTLFGRNTMAGAVQITSVQPNYEWGGSAEVTLGSRERQDVKLTLNLPIVDDKLAARLSVSRLRQDGYGERLFQRVRTGDTHNDAARVQVLFEPTSKLALNFSADVAQRRGNSSVETLLRVLDPAAFAAYNADLVAQGLLPITEANFVTGDVYRSWAGAPNGDDYDVAGAALTASYALSDVFTLKSISAYRSLETHSNYDFGAVPYPLSWQDITIDQEQVSQEVQLLFASPDKRLNGVIGAYYFTELGEQKEIDPYFELPIATGACSTCFRLNDPFINLYDIDLKQRTVSKALFAQASLALTDRLTLTGGLRYTQDNKRLVSSLYYNNTYQGFTFLRPSGLIKNEWTDWAPHFSAQYKPNRDAMLYFSISQGYKAGGYNGVSFEPNVPESFDPEEITSYEIGAKTEWLDRRLRLNGSAFLYDYQDVVGFAFVNSAVTFENIGELYVYGLEFEGVALLGKSFEASLSAGYLGLDIRTVRPGGEISIRSDTRLPNFPEWSGDFSLKYENTFEGVGGVSAIVSATYKGRHEFLLPNRLGEAEPGYTLFNASTTWTPNPDAARPISVTLFGRNLSDEEYKIYAENGSDFGFGLLYAQYGRPREWGIALKYAF